MNKFRTVRNQFGFSRHADFFQFPPYVTRGVGMVMNRDRRVNSGAGIGLDIGPLIGPLDDLAPVVVNLTYISIGGSPGLGLGPVLSRGTPIESAIRGLAFRLGGGPRGLL